MRIFKSESKNEYFYKKVKKKGGCHPIISGNGNTLFLYFGPILRIKHINKLAKHSESKLNCHFFPQMIIINYHIPRHRTANFNHNNFL